MKTRCPRRRIAITPTTRRTPGRRRRTTPSSASSICRWACRRPTSGAAIARRRPSAIRARWWRSTSTPANASGPIRPCITISGTWTCRRSRRLVDLTTANGIVPAIVQPTKSGNLFVLDRRTGAPIVPAPERPVPQGAAPGDHVSPTQPFSELTFRPEALAHRRRYVGRDDVRSARLPHHVPSLAL